MTKEQLDERLAEIWKACDPKPWRKWDQYVVAMKATHGIADDAEPKGVQDGREAGAS